MALVEKLPWVSKILSSIKEIAFGEDHSRIDMILDYFFSLRHEKRAKIFSYAIVSIVTLFLGVLFMYFFSLHNLQKKLNNATHNFNELTNLRPTYIAVNLEFSKLAESLQKNNQYNLLITALEQKTKDLGLEYTPFPEKPVLIDLQNTDQLFSQFQKVKIDYKISNISLRKIIDYINTIQQLENRIKVTKLEIQQKFGTKLYFDVNLTVEAYVPLQKKEE